MLSNLIDLKAGNNEFSGSINIANNNNINMWRINVGPNHNLLCVQVDTGAINGYTGWGIPVNASYNTICL